MLYFRPHHFMCTLGFIGEGYSPEFIKNYTLIVTTLTSDEHTLIKVVFRTDSICAACPHQRPYNRCVEQKKIETLDQSHAKVLDLKNKEVLTWAQAKKRISQKMTLKKFHEACHGCAWKGMGVCEVALKNL